MVFAWAAAVLLAAGGAVHAARSITAAPPGGTYVAGPGVEIAAADGGLRGFRIETPEGWVSGTVERAGADALPVATLRLLGAPDNLTLTMLKPLAATDGTEVLIDFGAPGSIRYRVGPDGQAAPVTTTIADCSALEHHRTYGAVRAASARVEDLAAESARTFAPLDPQVAAVRVLLALIARAPSMVDDCRAYGALAGGFCGENTAWEEDCTDCCEFVYGVSSVGARMACAAIGAAMCSPSGPTTVACAAAGAMACVAVLHLAREGCLTKCSAKPRKPSEGEACSTLGVCRDACGTDEERDTGTCAGSLVCCKPKPTFP